MVIVLKKNISDKDKNNLKDFLSKRQFKLNEVIGDEDTILAAVGKMSMDIKDVELQPGVSRVIPISKPYKMASREFKRDDTIVEIPNSRGQIIRVGGQRLVAIAGPCAVESLEQIMSLAASVASSGAVMLKGGTFQPRSSPYSFHGLGLEGLRYLREAGDKYGLPIVTELPSAELIPTLNDYTDVYQIGSRNMQDFDLLKKVGSTGKPVILKRGYTSTLEEFLMSAEYLLASGTDKVILCERGIRTFEHATRNTLDLSAIPILRSLTHLPIIVAPGPAVGIKDKIPPMALASIASGADGIMIEIHNTPDKALVGGSQSILPAQFDKIMHDIEALAPVLGKSVAHIRADTTRQKVVCAYSGKRGAYAEQAINRYFDSADVTPCAVDSFGEIFQSVIDGKADYGMIPIENSLAGSVYQNYDNFSRFEDVTIVGAVTLNIRHSLLAPKNASLETIKTVYSHPQAMGQCRRFLEEHKAWNQIESVSTATAAELVSRNNDISTAAIASSLNAKLYGLEIIAEDIEDDPSNFTRFVVIQSSEKAIAHELNIKPNIASFIFQTKNAPGALYNTLGIFFKYNVNLTRLESRPIQGQPWTYRFYADAELSNIIENNVADIYSYVYKLKEEMKASCEDVRLLGIYSEGHI